ncbi:MAG: hypothetical protein FWG65_05520 [Turicibacter sp.]|nr:hypothetical protein [Turicibacter sp.]
MNLDTVEKTVLKLLEEGYTLTEIARFLGLDLKPVLAELQYKQILKADNTFNLKPYDSVP